jgi:hypothetical protein
MCNLIIKFEAQNTYFSLDKKLKIIFEKTFKNQIHYEEQKSSNMKTNQLFIQCQNY